MSNLIVRSAIEADVVAITAIYNEVIATSNAIYRESNVETSERLQWFLDKQAHGYPIVVAQIDGAVVGYGAFGAFRFGEGYNQSVEHSLHVSELHRGCGIGKKLLEELIAIAKLQKRRIMIAAIDSGNTQSIGLHVKYGFVETARMPGVAQKNGQLLDLVLMQKAL